MLGIGNKKLREKANKYDKLLNELEHIVVHIDLNGAPLFHCPLYQLMLMVRYSTNGVELIKTHGNARVEGKVYNA